MVVFIAAAIAMCALAIDIARMYLIHAELQASADAGALAGAQRVLVQLPASGFDTATAYAQANLVEDTVPTVAPADVVLGTWNSGTFTSSGSWMDPTANAVQVTSRYTGSYVFGRFFNITNHALSATAIALVGSVGSTSCVRPLAIPYASLLAVLYPSATPANTYNLTVADVTQLSTLTQASQISLKVGTADSSIVNGSFYAVREGPVQYANGTAGNPWSGANDFRDALGEDCSQLTPIVGVGDWLEGEQGNMQGPTRTGLGNLCNVKGNANDITCSPAVQVNIPIWDITDKSVASANAFHVKYIGVFMVTGYQKANGIVGYFSSLLGSGGFSTQPGPVRKIALVQ